jgi:Zn-dependent protease with chaperone function
MSEGNFFRNGESRLFPAKLTLRDESLIITGSNDDTILMEAFLSEASISSRIGNTVRHIQFPDGSRFETLDNAAIDKLQTQTDKHQWAHWLESHYSIIFVMLVTTIIMTWGMIQYGIPAGANWAAHRLPTSLQQESGETTLKYFDKYFLETSEIPLSRQNQLRQTFLNALRTTDSDIQIRIGFRKSDAMGANAFALPSGHIIFTDDLVNLACDDRELLAIYGHEVGHIEHRHMMRRVLQSSAIALAAALTFGDSSSMNELIVGLPTFLLEMNYSRDFERESDDFALAFLHEHQIAPGFFTSIMNRIESTYTEGKKDDEGNQVENYFLTHPPTSERTKQFGKGITGICKTKNPN